MSSEVRAGGIGAAAENEEQFQLSTLRRLVGAGRACESVLERVHERNARTLQSSGSGPWALHRLAAGRSSRLRSPLSPSLALPTTSPAHAMATPSPHALTQHLLSRLEADLAFLHSQQLLSLPDLDLIRSKLAPIHAEQGLAALSVAAAAAGTSSAYAQQERQGQQRMPPPPPVRAQPPPMCRAVWDYAGGQVRSPPPTLCSEPVRAELIAA